MKALLAHAALFGLLLARHVGLGPGVRSTATEPIAPTQLAQLWAAPDDLERRDLMNGPWGADAGPPPAATYRFVARKEKGFSPGFDVRGPDGTEWSIKLGDEAQSEVVVSRILSAVGYHQPPVYYLPAWQLTGGPSPGLQPAGRFRPKLRSLRVTGNWSWQHNPFVGTRPYAGLIVLMMVLNNSDLGTLNNFEYDLDEGLEGARHWFVVRDLGGSLGETGYYRPRRNVIDAFELQPLIRKVRGNHVVLEYHGLERELLKDITIDDVGWTCGLLSKLSREQWEDAFRAGGYAPDVAARYIRKIQEKVSEGLATQRIDR
jgi:hypothetical protein